MSAVESALILVVEDEDVLRHDIVEELQEAGYRAMAAADGSRALERLEESAPDLLLCDISMPGLDGYELLNILRQQRPELATTPFVFLTALAEPREVVEGKLLGADDYLVKPVDYDLMLATIAARLRQVERIRSQHAGEVATLRKAIGGLAGEGAEQALDLIALGIVLLDARGGLVHANRAAQEMIADGDFIHAGAQGLRSPDVLSDRALQHAIGETLKAAEAGEEKVVGAMLQRAKDTCSVSALACVLARPEASSSSHPSVALFLSASERRRRVPETLLMELFGLTPTEARVAGALANSARATDVAEELGVSQTTIAFHMRNLFHKTGTNRQADLIALILAGPMMIQSDRSG